GARMEAGAERGGGAAGKARGVRPVGRPAAVPQLGDAAVRVAQEEDPLARYPEPRQRLPRFRLSLARHALVVLRPRVQPPVLARHRHREPIAVGDEGDADPSASPDRAGNQPAHAERLIIAVRRHDQHRRTRRWRRVGAQDHVLHRRVVGVQVIQEPAAEGRGQNKERSGGSKEEAALRVIEHRLLACWMARKKRSDWDSNPGGSFVTPYTLSRGAPSTARTSLRGKTDPSKNLAIRQDDRPAGGRRGCDGAGLPGSQRISYPRPIHFHL